MSAKKKMKKNKTKPVRITPVEKNLTGLELLLQYGLLFLVLFSPYYRGLYFDYERYPFFLIIFILAAIFFFYHIVFLHKKITLNTPIELFFLFFVLLYGLGIFWAADKGLAFKEFFSYSGFFLFFLLVTYLFNNLKLKRLFLFVFGINTLILVMLGFFYRFGWINPLSRPFGMNMQDLYLNEANRLQSTLQYPNTFAAYIALGIISFFIFSIWEEKPLFRYLSVFGMFFLQAGLYFTYSRGGLLVIGLSMVFLLLALPRLERKKSILLLIVSFTVTLLFSSPLEYFLINEFKSQFFGLLLTGGLVQTFAILITSILWKKSIVFSRRSYIVSAIILGVVILSFVFLFNITGRSASLFSNRLRQLSLSTIISQERWIFYHDALKLSWSRPFTGWGGGGWKARYFAYQSYPYFSENPHNYYLQIISESGFLGLLFMIGLIFSLFYGSLRFKMTNGMNRDTILVVGICGILFMGFAHGFIDVDFSLGTYQYAIWMFAALVNQYLRDNQWVIHRKHFKKITIPSEIGLIVALVFIILSVFMMTGGRNQLWGDFFASRGEVDYALQSYQKASRSIPFSAENHYSLSQLYRQLFNTQQAQEAREKSEYHGGKAFQLSPFNYLYLENLAVLYIEKGEFDKGLRYFENAITQAPFIANTYEHYEIACQSIAEFFLLKNQKKQAVNYYEKALHADQLFDQFSQKSIVPIQKPPQLLTLSQNMRSRIQELRE